MIHGAGSGERRVRRKNAAVARNPGGMYFAHNIFCPGRRHGDVARAARTRQRRHISHETGAGRREARVAYRTFRTDDGRDWQVWDVDPTSGSSRLPGMLPGAWLCFECTDEKRRLHPVPEQWAGCSDGELEAFRQQAVPVARRHIAGSPALPTAAP
jgi:hypothetical protein